MAYRGVNLGGWLVLERWMTPSLFEGLEAKDEHAFCLEHPQAAVALKQHRDTFVTDEDLAWIAAHGLNAIRVPVPHWAFGGYEPFVACQEYLDWFVERAPQHGLRVLLDVHTAPGSQNGWDHSGRAGEIGWGSEGTIQETLNMLSIIADRYKSAQNLIGLEVLNEPHPSLALSDLLEFYGQAASTVRTVAPAMRLLFSDAFRPREWAGTNMAQLTGGSLDMHLYQAFDEADKKLSMHKHIKKAAGEWRNLIQDMAQYAPVIVGEWSLGLDKRAFRGMDDFERDKALQAYARAQIETFSQAEGWFFWNYKTEDAPEWSYRAAVARGWLPNLVQ